MQSSSSPSSSSIVLALPLEVYSNGVGRGMQPQQQQHQHHHQQQQQQGAIVPHHAHAHAHAHHHVQFIPVPIEIPTRHQQHLRGLGLAIVPYVSREVFPLRVIYYLLQEEDDDDDDDTDDGTDDDDDFDDHDNGNGAEGNHHGGVNANHHHRHPRRNNRNRRGRTRTRRQRHVHIHVPIALALHPNTILSYGDRGVRRNNHNIGPNNHHHHAATATATSTATSTARNDLHEHDRRKRVKLEEEENMAKGRIRTSTSFCSCQTDYEDANVCDDDIIANININTNINTNIHIHNPVEKVCDIEGILQHILGYNHNNPQDLLSASLVNHRWFEAARDDELWKCACAYAWGNKVGMPLVRRGGSIALFWRSLWGEESVVRGSVSVSCTTSPSTTTCTSTKHVHVDRGGNGSTCTTSTSSGSSTNSRPVSSSDRGGGGGGGCHQKSKMSVKDIKGLFAERPLGRKVVRDAFSACFEKTDMQKAVVELMPETLGGEECGMCSSRVLKRARGDGFDRLWFGSFASSMIDSKRTVMTLDELLSRRGFLMHFKVFHSHVTTTSTQHDTNGEDDLHNSLSNGDINDRGEREEDVSLHFHCICYFDEAVREGGEGDDDVGPPVGKFRLDDSNDREMEHPQNLTWHWLIEGKTVQVGQYPPLVVHRLDDWGWRIENRHVVLYSQ